MKKSEFIMMMGKEYPQYPHKEIERAVQTVLDKIVDVLGAGGRVEVRGFGSFSVRERKARLGRNPKTGASLLLNCKRVPRFKPGKALRCSVNQTMEH